MVDGHNPQRPRRFVAEISSPEKGNDFIPLLT